MAWLLVAGGLSYVGASAVTQSDRVTPANFSGYASGTGIHAHLLRTGTAGSGYPAGTEVLDVDEAFSASSVNTAGLSASLSNELGTLLHTSGTTAGKQASGRGSGLELGLATDVPVSTDNRALILSGVATATAPPDTPVIQEDIGPIQINPLLFASVLHGEAQAQFGNLLGRCPSLPLVNRFAYGEGHLAQAQLINSGTAPPPNSPFANALLGTDSAGGERAAFTQSTTYPIDNGDGTFGLVSEVHTTVAPIRISTAAGPLDDIVIRVIGEAVMKVTATGKPGGASVQYTKPPTISIQQGILPPVDIIPALPIPLGPLGGLFEDARRIGSQDSPLPPEIAANGTVAAAAADVARVTLPGGLLDVRLLHTEARVQVPAGGFSFNECGRLRITKNVVGNAPGPFNFHVVCPGVTLLATESDFSLANGESKVIAVPSGSQCTVTEPGAGGATQTTGVPATVTIPTNMAFVDVNVVNSNIGTLQVIKSAQAGLDGPFTFSAACTDAGGAALSTTLVPTTFTLGRNENRVFPNIPGGTNCTIAETGKGGASVTRIADSTAPNDDGKVRIAGGDVQIVTFSNAGPPLVIAKQTSGEDAAGKGPFRFHVECLSPTGTAIALDAADADFTLAAGGVKAINKDITDGSVCTVTEPDNGGATSVVITDTDSTTGSGSDGKVKITHGVTQGVAFANSFPRKIKLVVTKTVNGSGSGPFAFTVTCTQPGGAAYILAPGDASFTLNGGQSRSIANIPDGSTCTVNETDARGATRAYLEGSGTPNDGIVVIPAGTASAVVGVVNTFIAPLPPGSVVAPIAVQPRTVG